MTSLITVNGLWLWLLADPILFPAVRRRLASRGQVEPFLSHFLPLLQGLPDDGFPFCRIGFPYIA